MTISFLSLPALRLPGPTSGPSGLIVAPSDEGLDVASTAPMGSLHHRADAESKTRLSRSTSPAAASAGDSPLR